MDFWEEPDHDDSQLVISSWEPMMPVILPVLSEPKNPIRPILNAKPWMDGDRLVGFEVKGEAFLWNQVRRMANALFDLPWVRSRARHERGHLTNR